MKPSLRTIWSPPAIIVRMLGGKSPGSRGDRYHPNGYDLKTIGPTPQEGKGIDEMKATVEFLKARGVSTCPFTGLKKRKEEV